MKSQSNIRVLLFAALTALTYSFISLYYFHGPLMAGNILAPEDGKVQNYPGFFTPFMGAAGALWSPFTFCGFPVLADPQLAMFYPLRLLFQALGQGFDAYVLSGFVLAALFTCLYVRKISGSKYGALFAGLIYGLSGYAISELRHVQIIHSLAWLPFLLWQAEFADNNSLKKNLFVLLGSAIGCACLIFAGHSQTAFYVLVVVLAYTLFVVRRWHNKLFLITGLTLGIALCAIQILPTLELVTWSVRPSFTMHDFLVGEVSPSLWLGFLMPYIFGGNYAFLESSVAASLPFAQQGPPLGLLYVGIAPVLLTAYALLFVRRNLQLKFLMLCAAASILVSIGHYSGLATVFSKIPVLGSFRCLYRTLFILVFFIAVASGLALARLAKAGTKGVWPSCKLEARILANFKNLSLGWTSKKHFSLLAYVFFCALLPPLLPGTLPLLFYILWPQKLWTKALLFLASVGVLAGYAFECQFTKACPTAMEMQQPLFADLLKEKLAAGRYRILTVKGIYGTREELPPNLNRLWMIHSASGYEPLLSKRYAELVGMSEGGFLQPPWRISPGNRVFDILSVIYLIAPMQEFSEKAFSPSARQYYSQRVVGGVNVWENLRVLPRCRLVEKTQLLAPQQILQTVRYGYFPDGKPFDPAFCALVEEAASEIATENLIKEKDKVSVKSEALGVIHKVVDNGENLELYLETKKPCALIIADSYDSGWHAFLNDKPTPIYRANYVQRLLKLPAGHCHLRLIYSPKALAIGQMISLTAVIILTGLCITAMRLPEAKEEKSIK
jgi:hypothetical protein